MVVGLERAEYPRMAKPPWAEYPWMVSLGEGGTSHLDSRTLKGRASIDGLP